MANSKSLDNLNVYDWIILILSMIGGIYQILICISLLKLFYRSKNTIKYDTGILSNFIFCDGRLLPLNLFDDDNSIEIELP